MPVFVLEFPAHCHHSYAGQVIERVLPLDQARQACAQMGLRTLRTITELSSANRASD